MNLVAESDLMWEIKMVERRVDLLVLLMVGRSVEVTVAGWERKMVEH